MLRFDVDCPHVYVLICTEGEAQCIDRLMEAFAIRLYEVQLSVPVTENHDQSVEETMLDTPHSASSDVGLGLRSGTLDPPSASEMDSDDHVLPFKSSDAAFILSFSTIMLNTGMDKILGNNISL